MNAFQPIETATATLAQRLSRNLHGREMLSLPPIPTGAEALLVHALATNFPLVLWISDGIQTLEQHHQDLCTVRQNDDNMLYYPAWESLPERTGVTDRAAAGYRLAAQLALTSATATRRAPILVLTCIQALLQGTTPPKLLGQRTCRLQVGAEQDLSELVHTLLANGYHREPQVEEKGTVAVKGGILDCWPLTCDNPIRIEFFGPMIESIRTFSPNDQRSITHCKDILLPPADEPVPEHAQPASLLQYLPDTSAIVWSNLAGIQDAAKRYEQTIQEGHHKARVLSHAVLHTHLPSKASQIYLQDERGEWPHELPDLNPLPAEYARPPGRPALDVLETARHRLLDHLRVQARQGQTVMILLDSAGSRQHLEPYLAKHPCPGIMSAVGALSEGFSSRALALTLVTEADLYGRRKTDCRRYQPQRRAPAWKESGERIATLSDLEPGDFVVHVEYGIGRFLGLQEIVFQGEQQEVLSIEYADNAKLHVPSTHTHLLSRYIGVAKHKTRLHRLGGRKWGRDRAAAEAAVQDMAAALLETQAQRELKTGFSFPPDHPWQHEFEATFPFQETHDQLQVIDEIKRDMEAAQPMDRLVCGDAGYGKTEVAMRAAFKAVMANKQVAVLVPTTVLAQQHYETFSSRMAPFPVRIERLSRFCSRSRHQAILAALKEGRVDLVIGTHALIQRGVGFRDLGLLIIDEEQRFGVDHKERLKRLRSTVDILTLTATPIPRTLYMSMTGARDMSLIQTPPRERTAIDTIVKPNEDKLVREAILRELNRDGQVFYLHNRVHSIDLAHHRLQKLVPEARMAVAHGQMPGAQLEQVLQQFTAGAFEVLICTTIIESGTDIPRVNTILIDRADRFGLADLYQLRGRVGRSYHKGYAYLLLPPHGAIDSLARKRIGTIKKYSSLSAGFNIAMRDLEIRGAGNLLGAAQSGHIAAVGFDLYCQMLRRTVARLKGETAPPVIEVELKLDFLSQSTATATAEHAAVIPYGYIDDPRLRVAAYRRISEATSPKTITDIEVEFHDRYGPLPDPVRRLLAVAHVRAAAAQQKISGVETRGDKLMLNTKSGYLMRNHRFPRLQQPPGLKRIYEIVAHINQSSTWANSERTAQPT